MPLAQAEPERVTFETLIAACIQHVNGGSAEGRPLQAGMGRGHRYAANGTSAVYIRASNYNAKSQVTSDSTTVLNFNNDTIITNATYYYNAFETSAGSGVWQGTASGGSYMGGVVTLTSASVTKNGSPQTGNTTVNSFVWWGGALQSKINYVSGSTNNNSTFYYDEGGRLQSIYIQDGRPRTVSFVTDSYGQVLQRDESDNSSANGDPRELHYYFNGVRVGAISNNGTANVDYVQSITQHQVVNGSGPFRGGSPYWVPYADFDQSYDAINGLNYEATASSYTVNEGDTLQTIAQNLWGDTSLWYMIANAIRWTRATSRWT